MITVLLPVWKGADCIEDTMISIISQTFSDWEMLVMGEPDSDDAIKIIALAYSVKHENISYIENEIHLGLAATLNRGIELARGKYIARVDVDDPSYPNRFNKQVEYMETHDDVAVCGTQQLVLTPYSSFETRRPTSNDEVRTAMLFYCSNCHSTLFLRRELFIENNWRYPIDQTQEDFALWSSIIGEANFHNLNEVLVSHRIDTHDNLTSIHRRKIAETSSEIFINSCEVYFGIDASTYAMSDFFCRYGHVYKLIPLDEIPEWLIESYNLFHLMENSQHPFSQIELSRTLCKQWNWMLDRYFIFDSWLNIYGIQIPHLSVRDDCRFIDALQKALNVREFQVAEKIKLESEKYVSVSKLIINKERFQAIIFGVGYFCIDFFNKVPNWGELFELVAFADNDHSKVGTSMLGKQIISADELASTEYDFILVSSRDYYSEIHSQLMIMGIPQEKILPLEIFRLRAKQWE